MWSLVLGQPLMSFIDWALWAPEYTLTVYLFLILSTVLIRICATFPLTSEKNIPYFEGINTWLVPSVL